LEPKPPSRFSKDNRLLDAAAFARVFDNASRSRDNWFTVLGRANKLGKARLGLAISKKNCKLATGRNRIKRVVRESFRHHQDELSGVDVVVMNKPLAARATTVELLASLENHWQRLERSCAGGK
jgi:ribonuclease P protein component